MSKYSELFLATTDTVPGIGAPVSEANKELIYKIKERPRFKKLVIMVGSIAQAQSIRGWNNNAQLSAKKFWPGPTTLVINDHLAMRMPDNKQLCDLILALGPIYMTSANVSGKKNLSLAEAIKVFPQIEKHYDFGSGSGNPSTIININTREVLR